MPRSKKSIEERIDIKDDEIQKLLERASQLKAQKRQLEQRKKAEDRKARTHSLIVIGGVVSSVLNRDFAEGDGNPHAHIMLSVRAIDENEKWTSKQKSVFANARDDKGRPVYDPSLPSYNPKDKENTSKYRIPVLDENGNQKTRERKGKGTEYLWERISIPCTRQTDRPPFLQKAGT